MTKTERIILRIDPATKEQAKRQAAAEGRSLSNYILELVLDPCLPCCLVNTVRNNFPEWIDRRSLLLYSVISTICYF